MMMMNQTRCLHPLLVMLADQVVVVLVVVTLMVLLLLTVVPLWLVSLWFWQCLLSPLPKIQHHAGKVRECASDKIPSDPMQVGFCFPGANADTWCNDLSIRTFPGVFEVQACHEW